MPDFFDLAEQKLDWINTRAGILASNVANADTPGFKAKDLRPFSAMLSSESLALSQTDPSDLPGDAVEPVQGMSADGSEAAPDGNGISIDQQMRLIASNDQDQSVVTTLYKKYVGMTDVALGVSG